MTTVDFVMTIDSDGEGSDVRKPPISTNSRTQDEDDPHLNTEFSFDFSGDHYADILDQHEAYPDLVKKGLRSDPISVDDIIARRKMGSARKKNLEMSGRNSRGTALADFQDDENDSADDDSEDEGQEEEEEFTSDEGDDGDSRSEQDGSDENNILDARYSSSDDEEIETQAEKDRKAAFFDSSTLPSESHSSFLTMNLSRPILKAIAAMGFHKPTPIQEAAIPVALMGKDIVGGAVTGSGKTAAFIIPILERLVHRERGAKAAATRCLILVPTRELAVQSLEIGTKLGAHTDIRFCLIVGGLSLKSQEVALRSRPDVIIATPGRLIDHLRNSPSFMLDALDILVLDEADRMLSDGFADELTEIIKSCPLGRSTMLFSATMTDSVDELVKMSLNKPVRLFVDPKQSIARGLIQEFVRVRGGKEAERPALLAALCQRSFKSGVIVFFRSKKLAHQMRIIFRLIGMNCEELHGDLSQEQRLNALQRFRDGQANFLMATDLASRGLDIKGIETVINYDMPGQLSQYLHRVGRTARAGKKGRSVTLVGEGDRKMLKVAIKHASRDHVRHRVIAPEVVMKLAKKLENMKGEVAAVLQDEKEEKQLRQAEMELRKGENMIEHASEIYSRPARTWFQSAKEKRKAEATSKQQYSEGFVSGGRRMEKAVVEGKKPKRDAMAGLSRKAKRRKMALADDDEIGMKSAIRAAKKEALPKKIGVPEKRAVKGRFREKKSGHKKSKGRTGKIFDREM